jgi:hypothetical protein
VPPAQGVTMRSPAWSRVDVAIAQGCTRNVRVRTAVVAVAVLLALAGAASAQVASPTLNPVLGTQPTPINPAVLSWAGPSNLAVTYGPFTSQDAVSGSGKGNVLTAHGQIVGGTFSAKAALVKVTFDTSSGTSVKEDFGSVQAAAQLGGWASLGAGQDSDNITAAAAVTNETTPNFGAAVRMAELFYLGYAAGTSYLDVAGTPADRAMKRYGAAFLSRGKSGALRVEIARETRDAVAAPVVNSQRTDLIALEARFGSVVIGFQSTDTDLADSTGLATGNRTRRNYSVAWVPDKGLAYSLATRRGTGTGTAGGQDSLSLTVIGVAVQF